MWRLGWRLVAACFVLGSGAAGVAAQYDPLQADTNKLPAPIDLVVHDTKHGRDIPLRVYLPADERSSPSAKPVVLFSHGLGGSCRNNPYLGRHWSARDYVVVFIQHPGSDESVWKGVPLRNVMQTMREAASLQNFSLRVQDVSAVLDQLVAWNDGNQADANAGRTLANRLDLAQVGMSGHSFGAVTTQAVSGQSFGNGRLDLQEPRIKAALMMSPSLPQQGSAKQAFSGVTLPWLLMTGTHDASRIGGQTPSSRLKVYPNLPDGSKYQLVLEGAEHSAFGDRALPGDRIRRNPNHHRAILAISTAFWDSYLSKDKQAMAWLHSSKVRQVLDEADMWERK